VSYQIFARKYRPQTFDELVGQKAVVQTLKNAVLNNRVAQAYIFSGMRGVGKTSAARILAKALNCQAGPTATPDNTCEFCRAINEDRAIDVIEIDGASNRGIDDVRSLRDGVKYRPIQMRTKVIIIDEVHMLTKEAFNALLKTLEEPPPQTVFIFATTEFQKVPATIVSRSQHFDFKKISHRDLFNHLLEITKKEGILIDPEGLDLLAEASDGSMRDAQSLLDQAVAFSGTNISSEDLREILGTLNRDILFAFSAAILDQKAESVFPLVERVIDGGYDLRYFAKELIQHFRNLLLVKSVAEVGNLLPLGTEDISRLKREAERATAEDFLRFLLALQAGEQGLRYSSHPRIALEALLVKLCHYQSITPLQELIREMENLRPGPSSSEAGPSRSSAGGARNLPPKPEPPRSAGDPPSARPAAAPVPPGTDSLKTLMPKVLTSLQRDRSSLAAILAQSSSWKVEEEPLDIKFNHDERFVVSNPLTLHIFFPRGKTELLEVVDKEVRVIEKAAAEAAGRKVHVKASEENTPGPRPRENEIDAALKDPTVQYFMDTFRARIVSAEPLRKAERGPTKGSGT
jgi:DNA polymerase-3 subunit gamma/tau